MNTIIRLVTAVTLIASAICARCEEKQPNIKLKQAEEVISLIAKEIIDPSCYILLAESRLDARMRIYQQFSSDQMSSVTGALDLHQFMPVSVIRGGDINMSSIWIQIDPYVIRMRKKVFYHFPLTDTEGVWLCFIKPVERLPRIMGKDTTQLNIAINAIDKTMPPHELAKKLGFNEWLNKNTWFELADEFSIFRVADLPIRGLELPASIGKISREQLRLQNDRIREVQKSEPIRQKEFTLSETQLEEIKKLIKLFQAPDKLPSVEELVAMKSEFADAILRELAKTSSENLNDGLRKVKETIPKKVLEDIFKQQ